MEPMSIITAFQSFNIAITTAKGALEIRDFNASAAAISQAQQKLIDLQQQFMTVSTLNFELVQEKARLMEKIRELEKERTDRERYALVEIFPGSFVYGVDQGPQATGAGQPTRKEPTHYVCQPCFDKGVKAVLHHWGSGWHCPVCKGFARDRPDQPLSPYFTSEWG